MQDVHVIERPEEANELLKPIRIEILKRLSNPRTCPELAKELGITTQKVNYHMNVLRESGLVKLIEERRNRGTVEGVYQAIAKSYWLSPRLIPKVAQRSAASDQASLTYLFRLAEDLQLDVGRLAERDSGSPVPSMAIDGFVQLSDNNERSRFFEELQSSIKRIAAKYGYRDGSQQAAGSTYRIAVACYPAQGNENE